MGALKQQIQVWSIRLNAMSFRERLLVFLAAVVVTMMLIFVGLIEPALKKQEQMVLSVNALQNEVTTLSTQLASSEQQSQGGKKSEASALRQEIATLGQSLKDRENGLIPPDKMIVALKSLLTAQPGLTLLSLQTEAPQPVFKEPAIVEAAANTPVPAVAVPPDEQLYRHGVELHVQGNYARLTDYVRHLEGLPWAMQWESLSLDASHSPQIEMTLKLYTLSRETTWAKF
ncbi:MAG: type II secretion system protein GspM [Thiobacillaceae bacterium]